MNWKALFERFEREGTLVLPGVASAFRDCSWVVHPAFAGVDLKQIVTAEWTGGWCCFYLVRIAPHGKIGMHVHAEQWETHEVIARDGSCVTCVFTVCTRDDCRFSGQCTA